MTPFALAGAVPTVTVNMPGSAGRQLNRGACAFDLAVTAC
jgi:hypothetical protein